MELENAAKKKLNRKFISARVTTFCCSNSSWYNFFLLPFFGTNFHLITGIGCSVYIL
jgi:hypothetical protein